MNCSEILEIEFALRWQKSTLALLQLAVSLSFLSNVASVNCLFSLGGCSKSYVTNVWNFYTEYYFKMNKAPQ